MLCFSPVSTQTWMPIVPFGHMLGYVAIALCDPTKLPAFSLSSQSCGDHIYMFLIAGLCEQV